MRWRALTLVMWLVVLAGAIGLWVARRAPSKSDDVAAGTPAQSLPTAAARASEGPSSAEASTASSAPSATATLAEPATPASAAASALPRAVHTEPVGVHVPLDAKVVIAFDRPVEPGSVTVTVDPPAEGKQSFRDAQTLVLAPVAWHDGKTHHVKVEGRGVEPATFQFTTLAPPPARIEPGAGSKITFTFDDGAADVAHVATLLDLLKKEAISAIFFPTGYWAETHPRLTERMKNDGHRVCNHTYSHANLRSPSLSDDAIRKEIIKGAGAGTCTLFRPPMRAYDERVERIVAELGYTLYLWDIDSRDWEGLPAEDMVNRVLRRARPGAVVLFHMHAKETLEALKTLIPRLRKAGYVFRDPEDSPAP